MQNLLVLGHRPARVRQGHGGRSYRGPRRPPIAGGMDASQGSSPAASPAVDPGVSSALPRRARSDALANVGQELGADRVYLFENIRDPDGRLWMNLVSEWRREGVRGLFDDPGTTLHPYSPDFIRWIEVLGDHRVLTGNVADFPESERRILAAEGTLSLVAVPIAVADGWWGFLAADDCDGASGWNSGESSCSGRSADAIADDVQRRAPGLRRTDRRRSLSVDRRAHPRRDVHRCARRRGVHAVHEPAGRGAARVRPRRVDERSGPVVADHPSGRSRARRRGEPASQRDRRVLLAGLPDVPQGRAGRVDPRRGADDPRRAWRPHVLARRDDRRHRDEARATRRSRS